MVPLVGRLDGVRSRDLSLSTRHLTYMLIYTNTCDRRLPVAGFSYSDWLASGQCGGSVAMSAQQNSTESVHDGLLGTVRDDPLSPQTKERVQYAVRAGCPTTDVARAVYVGLEGVLSTYWVALQEGKLEADDDGFYAVIGMRRYVRTCFQDRDRLLEFLEKDADFFRGLGRMTSWQR